MEMLAGYRIQQTRISDLLKSGFGLRIRRQEAGNNLHKLVSGISINFAVPLHKAHIAENNILCLNRRKVSQTVRNVEKGA